MMRQIDNPETGTGRSDRGTRRSGLAAGLAVGLVAVGIGGTAVAAGWAGHAPVPVERYHEPVVIEQSLGDVTLDGLADQLAELGLAVEITPAGGQASTGTDVTAAGDQSVDALDDPFAGMTDAEFDALSDEEFSAILEQAGWTIGDASEALGQDGGHGAADSEEPLGRFTVVEDRIEGSDASPDVTAEAQKIWQRFVELIPADQRQMVVGFELLNDDFGGAYVYPTDGDPTKWILGVGLDAGAEDLDYTLIHEFGHLLTLQAGQVPPGGDGSSCTTYFTGEGCALRSSTFARFVDRFWPLNMIDEAQRIEATGDEDDMVTFYTQHRDKFVTDYAATNPAEDLAETFAVFVLKDRPSGDTVADEKVRFLWNDPAMTELRDQIRTNVKTPTPVG